MKKFIIVIGLMLLGTGCLQASKPVSNVQDAPERSQQQKDIVVKDEVWADVITDGAPKGFAVYRSEELGIDLEYPVTLGRPWENWYKGMYPLAIKFLDEKGIAAPASISLSAVNDVAGIEEKNPKLRTCEDLKKKGLLGDDYPLTCVTKIINGNEVRVMTLTGSRLSAEFMTKLGVWSIDASEDSIPISVFDNIVNSLRFSR